jgi:phosphoserine phosphatase
VIVEFVESTARDLAPEDRLAVFDNDGTLWCEKPMPIQADFLFRRMAAMAEENQSLRDRQPWKAVVDKDYDWLGGVLTKHYEGDDSDLQVLAVGILKAYEGSTIDEFESTATEFIHSASHPVLGRAYLECAYLPMVELLQYLAANGFTTYIASGGGRGFMRTISEELYGVPRDRVIGSSAALEYREDGDVAQMCKRLNRASSTTVLPSRCRSGAAPGAAPSSPAETPTATSRCCRAKEHGWTVVSVKNDWATVFSPTPRG